MKEESKKTLKVLSKILLSKEKRPVNKITIKSDKLEAMGMMIAL